MNDLIAVWGEAEIGETSLPLPIEVQEDALAEAPAEAPNSLERFARGAQTHHTYRPIPRHATTLETAAFVSAAVCLSGVSLVAFAICVL